MSRMFRSPWWRIEIRPESSATEQGAVRVWDRATTCRRSQIWRGVCVFGIECQHKNSDLNPELYIYLFIFHKKKNYLKSKFLTQLWMAFSPYNNNMWVWYVFFYFIIYYYIIYIIIILLYVYVHKILCKLFDFFSQLNFTLNNIKD